jgi:radical SAM protein (TIGR01212 family)
MLIRKIYYEALSHPRVIGLAIATRPDCLGENIIELLSEINNKYFLWVELGLQTINEEVAKIINRQYSLKTYEEAAEKLKSRNIKFVTHIIIGLPGEKENDSLDTALFSEKCGTWGIKIHLLHIIKNTKLETLYKKNELKIQKKDEYVKKVVKILQNISYNIVIHRLTGDGNRDTLIAPLWSLNKRDVLNSIEKEMKMENIYQGGTEI